MSYQTEDTLRQSLLEDHYKELQWSPKETILRKYREQRTQVYPTYKYKFYDCVRARLQKSVFGTFLDIFNVQQDQTNFLNENKLDIAEFDLASLNDKDLQAFEERNSLLDNYMEKLKRIVATSEVVEYNNFINNLDQLRIMNSYVNKVDKKLKDFGELQVLILSGCNIRHISGSFLPRRLKFLELNNNFIKYLTELAEDPPTSLLHLGLGRNEITDDCCLDLLGDDQKFGQLRSIDLSDNDICSLEALLAQVPKMRSLRSLQLEGNPCYVDPSYKSIITNQLPQLFFLDNVILNESDRKMTHRLATTPTIVFYCYKIIALPPPPKDKSHNQTIHVEIDLPLLEKFRRLETTRQRSEPHLEEQSTSKKNRPANKQKGEAKKQKKKWSPYDNSDESKLVIEEDNPSFKTVKMPWSRILEFPPVYIESPGGNHTLIRDTLRSCVTVKVVYLKSKLHKKEYKDEISQNKTKRATANDKQETVVKRVVLYSFKCNLESLNWSDESMDFYWTPHPELGDKAIKMDGCLKNIIYAEHKPKKGKRRSDGEKDINVLPKIFTCQVGFGIARDPELVVTKSKIALHQRVNNNQ